MSPPPPSSSSAAGPAAVQASSSWLPSPPPVLSEMDSQNLQLLLALLPKIPLIVRVALLHVLRLSESSKYWDLRSALIITVLRSFLEPSDPRSITSTQKFMLQDPGIKGRIWVSKYTMPPPPETAIRDALFAAIRGLDSEDPGMAPVSCKVPELEPVEGEWTGYRRGVSARSELPQSSETEKYARMNVECRSPLTVLYFHGGAYYLMDPSTHRPTTKKIAKLTGGRCYSVRYRLAPQNPFPSALLDALLVYFSLLYPPPGAFHEPVQPEHIVFAGDSAGGNLSLALLQTVLELRRLKQAVRFHGQDRDVPLPAGVAVCSPWLDITQSFPSWAPDSTSARYDYLPTPNAMEAARIPPCEAWPSDPPRKNLYVEDSLLAHPLATLVMSPSWEGSPPVYMCTGWEMLADEDKYMAVKLAKDGVPVVFEEYEAMPHCFAMILTDLAEARRCFDGWTGFMMQVVEDASSVKSKATTIKAKTLQEIELDLKSVSSVSGTEMRSRVRKRLAAGGKRSTEGAARL